MSERAHDAPDGVNGVDVTRVAVGARVEGVTGADVAAGGELPHVPQSVQSVPAEQNFGSSHMLSFAYLQVSVLPPGEGATEITRVGARVAGAAGAEGESGTLGACVAGVTGADVERVVGAEVEDEHEPQVLGHALVIVAPWVP